MNGHMYRFLLEGFFFKKEDFHGFWRQSYYVLFWEELSSLLLIKMQSLLRNVCFSRDDIWLSLLSVQGYYNWTKHFSNRMNFVKQYIFKDHDQYTNGKASMINFIHRYNIWNMWHLHWNLISLFFYNLDKICKVFSCCIFCPYFWQHL